MFSAIPSDISTAIEAQWSARMGLFAALNAKTLDTLNKVTELNMHTLQQALARATASEPQPPTVDETLGYGRQLSHIVFDAGVDYLRMLQPSIAVTEQQLTQQFESLADKAPAPNAGMFDLLRNAFGQATSGYDHLVKASEQAASAIGAASAAHPADSKPAKREPAPKTVKNGKRA
ncbi:MAG: hypothetical protein H7Z39_13250 [Burkholderiaceae bacterium]|nr:hypothetical protein [Burkholderiaceae bacterium]